MDYFAVIYKNPDEDHIIIPHRFVTIWGHTLTNPTMMKTSFGIESNMAFKNVDNTLWLDRGWSAFSRDCEPRYRDVILFQYTADSTFVVSFFKPCGLEKLTPLHPNVNFPAQFFKPFMNEEYFNRMKLNKEFARMFRQQLRNPLTIYCDNGAAIEVQFIFYGKDIWLDKGWKDVSANCGLKLGDLLFFKYTGDSKFELSIVDNNEKPLTCTHKGGLVDVEPVVVHEQTLWFTKITKAVKGGTQPLHIPAKIVREWFIRKPTNIDIMLPSGGRDSWKLLWYDEDGNKDPRPNQCLFGHGWYEFAKKNGLPIRQHIRLFHWSNEAFMRVNNLGGSVVNLVVFSGLVGLFLLDL